MMIDELIQDKKLLEKQLFWINISFEECSTIGIKREYSVDEFGRLETLCSRYSRGIDFLIRKYSGHLMSMNLKIKELL